MRLIPALLAAGAAVAACTLVSCGKNQPPKPAAAAAAPAGALQGTVLEVLPAPPYTYLRLKTATGESWAAIPAGDFKVGAPIAIQVQLKMDKFESPSLQRTFDTLYMGTLAGGPGAAPAAAAMPAMPARPTAPDEKIEKASGANARTIADLWAQKAALKEQSVSVKGKVVKYNEGILGKNWLHLRDGSGAPQTKDNDITVTTKDACKVGDVVTVKGVVRLSKDFGSGYTYPVIIEDAKLVK